MHIDVIDVGSLAAKGRIRIIIADRNRMGSQLLAESLARDDRFEVVALAGPHDLPFVVIARKPDVAVISAEFDSDARKGIQLARSINLHHPSIYLVILHETCQREAVVASFRNGARGVFCRTEPISEFIECVERVSRGQIWASNTEIGFLLEALQSIPSCDGIDKVRGLSKREVSVAEAAAQGFTNKQIADQLGLSEHTIKNYLARIFEKLSVSNRIELLFLLEHSQLQGGPAETVPSNRDGSIETYLKAAEDGLAVAQFVVGMAYLEGCGIEKDEHSAYFWLRRGEQSSVEMLQHGRSVIENLKSGMKSEDIDDIERRIAARPMVERKFAKKELFGLDLTNVKLLSRRAG